MISRTYEEYCRSLRSLSLTPSSVLEIGSLASDQSLLLAGELRRAKTKVGLNLYEAERPVGAEMVKADARAMPFADNCFDLVLCASVLEHIPDFWIAVLEMRRVLAPGGVLIVSTPGYRRTPSGDRWRRIATALGLPDVLRRGTITMRIHRAPNDYYRFSEHCYRDVIMKDLRDVRIWHILSPPRIYATGHKPRRDDGHDHI